MGTANKIADVLGDDFKWVSRAIWEQNHKHLGVPDFLLSSVWSAGVNVLECGHSDQQKALECLWGWGGSLMTSDPWPMSKEVKAHFCF